MSVGQPCWPKGSLVYLSGTVLRCPFSAQRQHSVRLLWAVVTSDGTTKRANNPKPTNADKDGKGRDEVVAAST